MNYQHPNSWNWFDKILKVKQENCSEGNGIKVKRSSHGAGVKRGV